MARLKENGAIGMASRVVAASVGGLVFASAAIVALSYLLPGARVQAVIGVSLMGFAFWTGAVIWAFATRTATRAWAGLAIGTALAAGVALLARMLWP